jgi:hypothetical protein
MAKPGPHGKDKQRCGARTRHRHGFCKKWPVPGKERCRFLGGLSTGALRVIWARHVARFLPHGKCCSLGYGRCLPGDVLTGRNSVLRIFVIAAALMLTPSAFAQQPSRYGTADEAKAMLLKVVAAVKADKTKALESLIKTFVCHLGQVFMLRDLPCRTTC